MKSTSSEPGSPQISETGFAREHSEIYDDGFPEHTDRIRYPAPGSPRTAERVRQLIEEAGFSARLDPLWGFDQAPSRLFGGV